jgi:antirestriction protein ArdC
MAKFDTYQDVTDAIIAQLEAGTRPWQKDWQGGSLTMPRRITGQPYRGINVLLLWASATQQGLTSDRWMTFKQATDLGGKVRKGSKGTRIVFFKPLNVRDTATGEEKKIPMLRTYTVFNADQIDGLPAKYAPAPIVPVQGIERDAAAEAALRSCGATIVEGGPSAFYMPATDVVTMPDFERFTSSSGYLATLAHELCHWTGHKSRMDRFGANTRTNYAFEELVAEMGAAFVGARLGIVGEHIENHSAYLASWLKVLRDDKRAIFKAASLAQQAADLVLANAGDSDGPGEGEDMEDDAETAPAPIAAPVEPYTPPPVPAPRQAAFAW